MTIGLMAVDIRSWNGNSRPICHHEADRCANNCDARPREFQKALRYISCGVREEDLVALLYFLLAPAYGSGQEVEANSPEILARRLLVVDGRDKEIVVSPIKSSERMSSNSLFIFLSNTSQSIIHLPVETEFGELIAVVQSRGARWPRTGVRIIVSSVAMMSSSRGRRDPVAACSDVAFEYSLGLALDAQIDSGLC